ncbi:ABC-type enterochelin transport system ATPase subunit [Psychrobacter sp. PL15]|uniref:TrlF family AAA-like ATPase n=1 Tax=Psychrobacter sp. PL15 TaxID=3071719 RepID=UPI002E06DE07|nr:ABC-type enterochelin transport system ATPase subunit [Psychrobacter sp. PL15]
MGPNNKRYARFFKCALQVNPASYIKYRGQKQETSEADYNQQLLDAAIEANIDIIGLADHGCVDNIDSIRELFTAHDIVVFPGFEIASSEKIHFVCLFDETKTSQELERILGSLRLLDPQDGIRPSRLSAEQLIDEVNQQNGFIYAAHSTSDNGILKIGKMNHVWQHSGLLSAQIPGSIEDLRGVENDFYRKVFLNKDPNYKCKREMVAINAADVCEPEQIKSNGSSCLIKMTKPCFTSFKQAFLDAGSRVRLNCDKPESYASAIQRVRIIGGYLDGIDIELSDHLNAVIGGRGTGKSTLLECIRFAFDMSFVSEEARKQHDNIIKHNLGSERGRIEIKVRSAVMHGQSFTVIRKYGSQPTVKDEYGSISPYHPLDLLPGMELYGQNEIYEITRNGNSHNQLIQKFLDGEHAQHTIEINRVLLALKDNRNDIILEIRQKVNIEAEIEQLPKLEDRAKQFEVLGIEKKLETIPKLEKEKQSNRQIVESISRVESAIQTLKDCLPDTVFLNSTNTSTLPNEALLVQQREILDNLKNTLGKSIVHLEAQYKITKDNLLPIQRQLIQQHSLQEQQIEDAFKDIPASHGKTGRQIGTEYQTLLKKIEEILPKQIDLKSKQVQLSILYSQRSKLLLELDQHTSNRSSTLIKSVKKLNKKLDKKVRLQLHPETNRQILIDFFIDCKLDGVGVRRLEWLSDNDFSPSNIANTIRQGEAEIKAKLGIPDSVVRAFGNLPEYKLLELEEIIIPDTTSIELNVKYSEDEDIFRPINGLSTGQQCTAVLHLLLLDNHDPLILDQPEDNLDNSFISELIISELRKAKLNRQFLFATHNANIPVFGDAEWIGVLSVEDNKGQILPDQQGAIDMPTVQELAVDILEGGESAFNQRREKYAFD